VTHPAVTDIPAPLRLRLDGDALVANWRALDRMSGTAACGAAIKADGYGLGAEGVATRLVAAGCRDFFVATWREAAALAPLRLPLAVLHGVREEDMPAALSGIARPVLNTPGQVARWKEAGGGACDVMIDTGMNRLGLGVGDLDLLVGLEIDTLMSHLACADEDSPMNERQRATFATLAGRTGARRMSLANSAGIALGSDYAFDLTRPGLALYGGVARAELAGVIVSVAMPQAQVLQRRSVSAGESVGYNALWRAHEDAELAILNLGYADGYPRSLSNRGHAGGSEQALPIIGRVSMDLVAVRLPTGSDVREGAWLNVGLDLVEDPMRSGRSAYELLVGLSSRFDRVWCNGA
jgi:alanine racemase